MRIIILVVITSGIGLVSALTVRAQAANGIKAIVHDSIITYDDVEDLTAQTENVLRNQFRNRPDEFRKKMEEARAENLEKLLGRELILHEFKTAGYSLPEAIIDELVQE